MTAVAPVERPAGTPRHLPGGRGVLGLLSTTDHKRLGVLAGLTSAAMFAMGGLLALLVRAELAAPGLQVVSVDAYNQVFTMHGATMFYLFFAPVTMAFGIYLVPLQIGAANIMWPRLALAGWWLGIGGALCLYTGFLTTQGAGKAAWTGVFPLSDAQFTSGTGQDLWVIGVFLAAAGVLVQAVCVLATIARRRMPGMTMLRIPVFTWAMTVACLLVLVGFPALLAAMAFVHIDRNVTDGLLVGTVGTETYQHLFWFFGHPVVYVVFFPFLAAASEAIATCARRRFFGYSFLVVSFLAFAALSAAVWGHHMFTTSSAANRYYSLTTTLIAIPAGIEYFDNIATMWRGRIVFRTSMLFALAFLVLFLLGGLSGVFAGSPTLDWHVHETHFVVAHLHFTLVGGSLLGLFAGVYHWFPKVTGRLLDERLGKAHCALFSLGTLLTFVPLFLVGHDGMLRRVADYPADRGWGTPNLLATLGAVVLFVAVAIFVVNVVRSLRVGARSGPDPWGGHTLEWTTSSPPPPHNFDQLPPVMTYAPLLDLRQEQEEEGHPERVWWPGPRLVDDHLARHGSEPPIGEQSVEHRLERSPLHPILRGWGVVGAYGVLLLVLWTLGWAVFELDWQANVVAPVGIAIVLGFAAVSGYRQARVGTPGDVGLAAMSTTSPATVLAAAGLVALAVATELGPWLGYIAAGMLVLAGLGLARERLAERDAVAAVTELEARGRRAEAGA